MPVAGPAGRLVWLARVDVSVAALALGLMTLIPLVEIVARPFRTRGIENPPLLVQNLGLVLAMFGAVAAERGGHPSTLGGGIGTAMPARLRALLQAFAQASAAGVSGVLVYASWRVIASEMQATHSIAYRLPIWWVQASMPLGFALLGFRLAA